MEEFKAGGGWGRLPSGIIFYGQHQTKRSEFTAFETNQITSTKTHTYKDFSKIFSETAYWSGGGGAGDGRRGTIVGR